MTKDECPGCGGKRIVAGRIFDAICGLKPFYFRPAGLKLVTLSRADAKIDGKFQACVDCGMLWSSVEPKVIQEIMQTSGTARSRERLKG